MMCEVTESESMERRLESLAAENERLKAEVSGAGKVLDGFGVVSDRDDGYEDDLEGRVLMICDQEAMARQERDGVAARNRQLAAENERLKAERDRMRAACEAARDFLEGKVDCGLARQEKGRVLKLVRAALDGVDPPAGDGAEDEDDEERHPWVTGPDDFGPVDE
jgi:cell division protein FtsB